MSDHAELSPSSSERWIQCPASVQATKDLGDKESSWYASEGTAFHALAEVYARNEILGTNDLTKALKAWRKEYGDQGYDEAEMAKHALGYVEFLRHIMAGIPHSTLLLEQRLDTGIPSCWGTGDAVIVSPTIIHVVDAKYGQGVRVIAYNNSQLLLYGVGALSTFGDILGDVLEVRASIFQPRLEHFDTMEISAVDLRAWREQIRPVAASALDGTGEYGPSEDACRWCPAAGNCPAQLRWATERDFGTPVKELSDEELTKALADIPAIEQWCNAVKQFALDRVYSQQKPLPGWKVVRSSGRRFINDEARAMEALAATGHPLDSVSKRKINGIGELEKTLGKKDFEAILSPFISKSQGNPSLVPESDRRLSIMPGSDAALDFEVEGEEASPPVNEKE